MPNDLSRQGSDATSGLQLSAADLEAFEDLFRVWVHTGMNRDCLDLGGTGHLEGLARLSLVWASETLARPYKEGQLQPGMTPDNIIFGVDFKAKPHPDPLLSEARVAAKAMNGGRKCAEKSCDMAGGSCTMPDCLLNADTSPSETNPVPYVAPEWDGA